MKGKWWALHATACVMAPPKAIMAKRPCFNSWVLRIEMSSSASEVRSQLPADTFAETPRLHRTSLATIDLRDSIWGWSKYVKINDLHWFIDIYRIRGMNEDPQISFWPTVIIRQVWCGELHQTHFFDWKDVKRHQGCNIVNIHSTSMSHPPTRIHEIISTIASHGLWLLQVSCASCCSW